MRRGAAILAAALGAALAFGSDVAAEPVEQPFTAVVHDVLRGDLVMAGNSNLVSAGGYRPAAQAVADVDGDATPLCTGRLFVLVMCGENSSSATLDVPLGARVVAARLYVNTSLTAATGAVRVRLDGPDLGYAYTDLAAATPGIPKVRESAGSATRAAVPMRQAVWDVTDYVRAGGPGTYTVADIMFERAGAYLPYASWTIVAAYELDPSVDLFALSDEQRARFDRRAITWQDGFTTLSSGAVEIEVDGFDVPAGVPIFAKTFHVAAHSRHRGADSLLFGGQPLGNNASPGNAPPPGGVPIGTDPACNSTTDILNDSICVLGAPVAAKAPGAADYVASTDGSTPSSGSGVDFDVTRVPDRYFVAGATSATLGVHVTGRAPVAVSVLAASVDLPAPSRVVAP